MCLSEANVTCVKCKEYRLQLKWQHWRESIFSGFWTMSRTPSVEHYGYNSFAALGLVMEHVQGEFIGGFAAFSALFLTGAAELSPGWWNGMTVRMVSEPLTPK